VTRAGRAGGWRIAATVAAAVVALAWALAGRREEFATALQAAPIWLLLVASALQIVALVARSEAWHASVCAAGGCVKRRRLHRAAGIGNLASVVNTQLGTAARIAILRRTAPDDAPRVSALVAAEVPIISIEVALAAIASFTLVGPLGLPWWIPLLCLAAAAAIAALGRLSSSRRRECWPGLAVLRSLRYRNRVLGLVLVAVCAQILRNWLMLHAVGVDASVFDATAVLIAMVTLSQLPIGPSVGAAAVVLILGARGVAATAAAGVPLTATGTAGALCFAAWAAVETLRPQLLRRSDAAPATGAEPPTRRPPVSLRRSGNDARTHDGPWRAISVMTRRRF
jgi:uncharacterized membrane protein YbhN (UPF0104 family)